MPALNVLLDLSDLLVAIGGAADANDAEAPIDLSHSSAGSTTTIPVDNTGADMGETFVAVVPLSGVIGSGLVLFDDSLVPATVF